MTAAPGTSTLSRAVHDPTTRPHGARQRWGAGRVSAGQASAGFAVLRSWPPSRSCFLATSLL